MTTLPQESMSSDISVDVQTTLPTVSISTVSTGSVARSSLRSRPPARDLEWGDRPLTAKTLHTAHIHCRVCNIPATVSIDHPALLCPLCMEDLDKTGRHIADVYAAVLVRFQRAWEALEEAGSDNAWWAQVWAYKASADFDADLFAQAWARAKTSGGDKAALCALWEALDTAAAELERIELWYRRASAELHAARDAARWPTEV